MQVEHEEHKLDGQIDTSHESESENESQTSPDEENDEHFWECLKQCSERALVKENHFEGGHLIVWGCGEFGEAGGGRVLCGVSL